VKLKFRSSFFNEKLKSTLVKKRKLNLIPIEVAATKKLVKAVIAPIKRKQCNLLINDDNDEGEDPLLSRFVAIKGALQLLPPSKVLSEEADSDVKADT
jgi:hypothetical protein